MLDAIENEPVDLDLSDRSLEGAVRDARRESGEGDDASDVRDEVDRFLHNHFAPDEAEIA